MKNSGQPFEYEITVIPAGEGEPYHLGYSGDKNLLEALMQQGIYLSAVCGGRGVCGKCKVRVMEGNIAAAQADREIFSGRELEQGWRLSCMAYPKENCTIRLAAEEETDFDAVTEYRTAVKTTGGKGEKREDYAIGIDIGTTTLALSLVGLSSRQVCRTYTAINKQRAYGADVISRILASNSGRRDELKDSIRRDLLQGIQRLTEKEEVSKSRIKKIAIAGNTTMGHLLMGYSCETLGSYPFTPVNISTIELPFLEVFGTDEFGADEFGADKLDAPVVLLPGISAFVGGDIVAGLLACDFDKAEKPCLFLDLGTNGEMAAGNKDRLLVSSAAAGPALEGGNISCGTGSIPGAICNLEIASGEIKLRTIAGKAPVGICGTGVLELVSELIKAGLVDETGLLTEEYFEKGYEIAKDAQGTAITLTQKDIREVQLAKSAIRAGIEILLLEYGIGYEDIDTVYLAGGFGYKLNIGKAVHIGLLPEELSGKIRAVGNSALGGAVRYLTDSRASQKIEDIIKVSGEIHLANNESFPELYLKHMNF